MKHEGHLQKPQMIAQYYNKDCGTSRIKTMETHKF